MTSIENTKIFKKTFLKDKEPVDYRSYLEKVGDDISRTAFDTSRDLIRLTDYILPGDLFDTAELNDYEREAKLSRLAGLGIADVDDQIDPYTGKIKDYDTIVGMGVGIIPYLVGGAGLVKGGAKLATSKRGLEFASKLPVRLSKKTADEVAGKASNAWGRLQLSKPAQYTLAGLTTEQILTDTDSNLFNLIGEVFPQESQTNIINVLSADPNDTETAKRIKLLIADLGAGFIIDKALKIAPGIVKAFKAKNPFASDYKIAENFFKEASLRAKLAEIEEEKILGVDLDVELKEVPERVDLPTRKEVLRETEEGQLEIARQRSPFLGGRGDPLTDTNPFESLLSGLDKLNKKFLTSRGYSTKLINSVFNASQQRQADYIMQARQLGLRLDSSIKKLNLEGRETKYKEKINEILKDEEAFEGFEGLSLNEKISRLADEQDIPSFIAEPIVEARTTIDRLSKLITTSPTISKEVKESVKDNFGYYVRRSYRLFKDKDFEYDDDLYVNAQEDLRNIYMKDMSENIDEAKIASGEFSEELLLEEATKKADEYLQGMLSVSKDQEHLDYFTQVRKVKKFHRRNLEIKSVRELFGEIKDPSDNIIESIENAARAYEVNNFYDQLFSIAKARGSNDGFIITKKTAKRRNLIEGRKNPSPRDKFVKISGTGNKSLDGKYTTPEMLQFLNRQEDVLSAITESDNSYANLYKTFLRFKGAAQVSKTILSHVTQLRNLMGGMQFGLANGDISFFTNPAKSFNNTSLLWKELRGKGDKAVNDKYREYVKLGIINTSINVNQFRELINLADSGTKVNKLISVIAEGKNPASKLFRGAEASYMGVDDYFKMSNYENELATLKKSSPDKAEDILQQEAARIVQDTLPNYDRIPKGIRQLTYLPLGNFVSFPAEIIRTSANIVKQASKEITSGNTILRNRGIKRLAGFTGTLSGFGIAGKMSANALGWNQEELESYNKLAEGKYNKNANNIWSINEETGNLQYISTKYLDSYNTIKTPVVAVVDKIVTGELEGKQLDDYLGGAIATGAKELFAPFLSESIATKAILDVSEAFRSEDGQTREGKRLFPPSNSSVDNGVTMFYELVKAIEPGSVTSLRKLTDTVNKYTGEPFETIGGVNKTELISNTGLRVSSFDPDLQLSFAVSQYKKLARNNVRSTFKIGDDTSEDVYLNYLARQDRLFQYQQELNSKIQAHILIRGERATRKLLRENKISEVQTERFINSMFTPSAPPKIEDNRIKNIILNSPTTSRSDRVKLRKTEREFKRAQKQLSKLYLLDSYLDDERVKEAFKVQEIDRERLGYKIGGYVEHDVPNTSKNPKKRIDKMTGMPYDIQAGTAFIDEEDPIRRLLGLLEEEKT